MGGEPGVIGLPVTPGGVWCSVYENPSRTIGPDETGPPRVDEGGPVGTAERGGGIYSPRLRSLPCRQRRYPAPASTDTPRIAPAPSNIHHRSSDVPPAGGGCGVGARAVTVATTAVSSSAMAITVAAAAVSISAGKVPIGVAVIATADWVGEPEGVGAVVRARLLVAVAIGVLLGGTEVAEGPGVRVRVGVRVAAEVEVASPEGVELGVRVRVGVRVGVRVRLGVTVRLAVGVRVGVRLAVAVRVGVSTTGGARTVKLPSDDSSATDWPSASLAATLLRSRVDVPGDAAGSTLKWTTAI